MGDGKVSLNREDVENALQMLISVPELSLHIQRYVGRVQALASGTATEAERADWLAQTGDDMRQAKKMFNQIHALIPRLVEGFKERL